VGFTLQPARQIAHRIASPHVLHKIAVALHDARGISRRLAHPALPPQHEEQATCDDAVAVKLEDTAIEISRSTAVSAKLRVPPQDLRRPDECLARPGVGRACPSQPSIRDHRAKLLQRLLGPASLIGTPCELEALERRAGGDGSERLHLRRQLTALWQ